MARDGWPEDWAERKAGGDCPICAGLVHPRSRDLVTGASLTSTVVRLDPRSRLPGYCVVAWNGQHVAEAFALSKDQSAAYWADVSRVARAIDRVFQPMKINLMTLGNWVPHLHTHIVPRYADDPAPGNPISWEDMFYDEPLPDATLRDHAERLAAVLYGTEST
ncbi:MAG TPA: HIT family protein [Mycobacteriales bacterium]|nr:HIT family protein [Mycobacteriales bacterium]